MFAVPEAPRYISALPKLRVALRDGDNFPGSRYTSSEGVKAVTFVLQLESMVTSPPISDFRVGILTIILVFQVSSV